MGRSVFKFTQAVGTNPQAQKTSLDRSYTFAETSTFTTIFEFSRKVQKKHKWHVFVTQGSDRAQIDQRISHARRYTELIIDSGSEACTLLRLGTDVRYSYVSVGVKMHPYYTISKHRYELAAWFSG